MSKLTYFRKILYGYVIPIALFTCYPRKYYPNFGSPRTLMSPFLFLLAIDWVIKTYTAQKQNGIQCTLWTSSLMTWTLLTTQTSSSTTNSKCRRTVAENRKKIGLNIQQARARYWRWTLPAQPPSSLKARRLKRWKASPILAASSKSKEGQMPIKDLSQYKAREIFLQLEEMWTSRTFTFSGYAFSQPTPRSGCTTQM